MSIGLHEILLPREGYYYYALFLVETSYPNNYGRLNIVSRMKFEAFSGYCEILLTAPTMCVTLIFSHLFTTYTPDTEPSAGWTTCTWRVWLRCWRWCRGCTTPWPGTRPPARTTTCSLSSSPPIQTPPSGHGSNWVLKVSDVFLKLHGHV